MTTTAIDKFDQYKADLNNIRNADEAYRLLQAQGVALADNDVDGIIQREIIDDKSKILGMPFVILSWDFHEGDFGDFVSALVIFPNDEKIYVLNDGSTGIFKQLQEITRNREENGHPFPQAGRRVDKGLRVSDYDYTDEKGKTAPAKTYYLAF